VKMTRCVNASYSPIGGKQTWLYLLTKVITLKRVNRLMVGGW